jgi:predicted negative regulator of RcsB-dependent stress response
MKRSERHHLKENELVHMTAVARQAVESRGRQVGALLLAVVVVAGALAGYFVWQSRQENQAGRLLAEAMAVQEARVGPPPGPDAPSSTSQTFATEREKHEAALAKFKAVADAYGSTDAGLFARYQQASLLMSLGKASEAATTYQEVIDRSGGVYGRMAKLGLAEAHANAGQFDQAIAGYKSLTEQKDQSFPLDGLLVQLGRTYLAAGKASDAQQTFERVVKEFPLSPFSSEAQRQLDKLKKV